MDAIEKNRKKFIEDWADIISKQAGVDDPIIKTYIALAVSQCMDSAILYKDKLDIGYEDGYILNTEED